MVFHELGPMSSGSRLGFFGEQAESVGWMGVDGSVIGSRSLLLMAEILHHLGCMKPYK